MAMATSEPNLARLPKADHRWEPRPHPREELLEAILAGGMSGVVSHPLDYVLWKIGLLCEGDPTSQFGLSGVSDPSEAEVMRLRETNATLAANATVADELISLAVSDPALSEPALT